MVTNHNYCNKINNVFYEGKNMKKLSQGQSLSSTVGFAAFSVFFFYLHSEQCFPCGTIQFVYAYFFTIVCISKDGRINYQVFVLLFWPTIRHLRNLFLYSHRRVYFCLFEGIKDLTKTSSRIIFLILWINDIC